MNQTSSRVAFRKDCSVRPNYQTITSHMERKGVFFSTEVCNVSLLYVDMWRRFWECQVCTYCMVPFLHCMIKNKFLSLVAWLSELIFSCRTNLPQPGNEIMKHFIIKDILITGVLFTVQKKKAKDGVFRGDVITQVSTVPSLTMAIARFLAMASLSSSTLVFSTSSSWRENKHTHQRWTNLQNLS